MRKQWASYSSLSAMSEPGSQTARMEGASERSLRALLSCLGCHPTRCPSQLPKPRPFLRPPAAAAANSGRFMGPVGLFAYSRHPNYFVSPCPLPGHPLLLRACCCRALPCHYWVDAAGAAQPGIAFCASSLDRPQDTHT